MTAIQLGLAEAVNKTNHTLLTRHQCSSGAAGPAAEAGRPAVLAGRHDRPEAAC